MEMGSGTLSLSSKSPVFAGRAEGATARFLRSVVKIGANKRGTGVRLRLASKLDMGPEGYVLQVTPAGVDISAGTTAGLFYGVQTLRQMLPLEAFKGGEWTAELPVVTIKDQPRFRWRGAHLDVGRHFMPLEFIKKYIDTLALHKMNRFHWHLTDDQGWRIEIKKYPKLTTVGSMRDRTMLVYSPATYEEKPHGGFYTQAEAREIVKYAAERHIEVMPEIEMPGHAQAAIAAYPELGNVDKPLKVFDKWGVNPNVYNVEDHTIQFNKDVLDEIIKIFPSKFIHVGGDECPKDQWKASPKVQAKMKALGVKTEHDMQSWFIRQMDTHLASRGRRLIGWSEILEGGLAPGAALMVWLGNDGAMEAVKSGHDVVMAQTTHTYFDYYQSRNTKAEPHGIGGFLPLEKAYSYEPILPEMTPEQASHVMGVQFQIWTEYIRTPDHAEYMAYPRGAAMAEVAWSPKAARNWADFRTRIATHVGRLGALGVHYRPLDE